MLLEDLRTTSLIHEEPAGSMRWETSASTRWDFNQDVGKPLVPEGGPAKSSFEAISLRAFPHIKVAAFGFGS